MPGRIGRKDDEVVHIKIQPQCGACLEPLDYDDRIVALIVRNGSIEAHDAHNITNNGYCLQGSERGAVFCKFPACKTCLSSDGFESATIHADCLSLFSGKCTAKDKYHRLWAASLAAVAWRAGSPLLIPPKRALARDISFADNALGTTMLAKLPLEVTCMIFELLEPHAIQRFSMAAERAANLSLNQPLNHTLKQTLQLINIQSWQREGRDGPVIYRDLHNTPPYMRICIDSYGICQIERLKNPRTPHNHHNSLRRDRLFIIEHVNMLTLVKAQFEYGYCRLIIPEHISIAIWNEPAPPPYSTIPEPAPTNVKPFQQCRRFSSINMDHCFGMTFFYMGSCLVAVHGHFIHNPTARETFRRLSLHQQSRVIWVYVPLSKRDKIIEFGKRVFTKQLFSIILKTELQRPRELGYFYNGTFKDSLYTVPSSWRLIHELGTSTVWPYMEGISRESLSPRVVFREEDVLLTNAHFSCASLENATAVSLFRATESGFCMGIILEYYDGTTTSLGQCRLGVDMCTTLREPKQLYWAAAKFRCKKTRRTCSGIVLVGCNSTDRECHSTIGLCVRNWSCQDMVGSVEFWFNDTSAKLRFVPSQ